jgi:hypothetical protein
LLSVELAEQMRGRDKETLQCKEWGRGEETRRNSKRFPVISATTRRNL